MSRTVLLAAVLVFASALPAGAQVSAQQLAKEAEIKARSPYATMRADIPALTLRDYNALVRQLAREELAKAQAPATPSPTHTLTPSGSSSKSPFTSSPFSASPKPTQEGFHFSPFNSGVGGAATRIEPFTIHDSSDQHGQSTMRTTTASGDFGFHFSNELSGTESQIGSFSLDDPGKATHCIKVPIGAFTRTRCF